jgi:ABC-type iron transport system FetAB permease component
VAGAMLISGGNSILGNGSTAYFQPSSANIVTSGAAEIPGLMTGLVIAGTLQ